GDLDREGEGQGVLRRLLVLLEREGGVRPLAGDADLRRRRRRREASRPERRVVRHRHRHRLLEGEGGRRLRRRLGGAGGARGAGERRRQRAGGGPRDRGAEGGRLSRTTRSRPADGSQIHTRCWSSATAQWLPAAVFARARRVSFPESATPRIAIVALFPPGR